mgnify:CR=1 FL=1
MIFRKDNFCYETFKLPDLTGFNYDGIFIKRSSGTRLQFGEGTYARIVDFFIDKMNETANFNSKVVLVQPIPKFTTPDVGDFINEQEGLYTLYLAEARTDRR